MTVAEAWRGAPPSRVTVYELVPGEAVQLPPERSGHCLMETG